MSGFELVFFVLFVLYFSPFFVDILVVSVVGVEGVAVWGGVGVPEDEEIVCITVVCCEVVGQDIHGCVVEYTFDDKVSEFEVVVMDDCVLFREGNIVDDVVIVVGKRYLSHWFSFSCVFVFFHYISHFV